MKGGEILAIEANPDLAAELASQADAWAAKSGNKTSISRRRGRSGRENPILPHCRHHDRPQTMSHYSWSCMDAVTASLPNLRFTSRVCFATRATQSKDWNALPVSAVQSCKSCAFLPRSDAAMAPDIHSNTPWLATPDDKRRPIVHVRLLTYSSHEHKCSERLLIIYCCPSQSVVVYPRLSPRARWRPPSEVGTRTVRGSRCWCGRPAASRGCFETMIATPARRNMAARGIALPLAQPFCLR